MPADVYSYSMLMLELWIGELVYRGINTHQVRAFRASCSTANPCSLRLWLAAPSSVDTHSQQPLLLSLAARWTSCTSSRIKSASERSR